MTHLNSENDPTNVSLANSILIFQINYYMYTYTLNVSIGSSTCKKVKSKFSKSKLTAFTHDREEWLN